MLLDSLLPSPRHAQFVRNLSPDCNNISFENNACQEQEWLHEHSELCRKLPFNDLSPPHCACSSIRPSYSPDFQSVLLRHRGDDTVHPQVLYKLPVVVCDVPKGND